jgi:hypothetical protein
MTYIIVVNYRHRLVERITLPSKGSPQLVTRFDEITRQGLRAYAVADSKTVSELVRLIIKGWVTDEPYPKMGTGVSQSPGGVYPTLQHMDGLVKELELQIYGVRIASSVDVQAEREELYRTALGILRDAVKLSENEELARKAGARMTAMQVATQASLSAQCVLRDYQRGDITALVDQLVKTNELLKTKLREFEEGTGKPAQGS